MRWELNVTVYSEYLRSLRYVQQYFDVFGTYNMSTRCWWGYCYHHICSFILIETGTPLWWSNHCWCSHILTHPHSAMPRPLNHCQSLQQCFLTSSFWLSCFASLLISSSLLYSSSITISYVLLCSWFDSTCFGLTLD